MKSTDEMNMIDEKELASRLNRVPRYRQLFASEFGAGPSFANVAEAISSYERTLTTGNSRFDRYARGDKSALTDAEKRGLLLFLGKAACSQCHLGPNFTDDKYYNIGLASHGGQPDLGRFEVTKDPADRGGFRTPSLRNVALTAPYMHDGSMASLRDVVDFYDKGGDAAANKSERMFALQLTEPEKADLIAFLRSLSGSPADATVPEIPR
jgi:cytochrome c peroxidase